MSVEQRQAAIVEATLPLLIEQGATIRTSDIAAAAGIAEGTVFRAFGDKRALFVACLHAAFESRTEVDAIESIDRTLPLVDRLTAAANAVAGYQERLWAVLLALRTAGIDAREEFERDGTDHRNHGAMAAISAAIARLFDPHHDPLRVAPDLAARLLLGLMFSNRMQPDELGERARVTDLVDLFLHGALRSPTGGRTSDD